MAYNNLSLFLLTQMSESEIDPRVLAIGEQVQRWQSTLKELINGLEVKTDTRGQIALTYYHLCTEHFTGIHVLAAHGLFGSANALIRPLFEAFVRGTWYRHCASDDEIERFLEKDHPNHITMDVMTKAVDALTKQGALSNLKKDSWDMMCSYTHGGLWHFAFRNTATEIKANYPPNQQIALLLFSSQLCMTACLGIAEVANSLELAGQIVRGFQAIFGVLAPPAEKS